MAATITAIFTGLGALPFLYFKRLDRKALGVGNALAAGLMFGASVGLCWEAGALSYTRLALGLASGGVLIWLVQLFIDADPLDQIRQAQGDQQGFSKILLLMAVMTVHSFAEGIGVGVAFGGRSGLGELVSSAIAIHNIPEGLAISLILIPRGHTVFKAAAWSIFSSLPQPLMAVPAFLFVLAFEPWLPWGLGLAAGAMFYMVFSELMPEAIKDAPLRQVIPVFAVAVVSMIAFQLLVG